MDLSYEVISILWGISIEIAGALVTKANVYGCLFTVILEALPLQSQTLNLAEDGYYGTKTALNIILLFVDIPSSLQNLKNINFQL